MEPVKIEETRTEREILISHLDTDLSYLKRFELGIIGKAGKQDIDYCIDQFYIHADEMRHLLTIFLNNNPRN